MQPSAQTLRSAMPSLGGLGNPAPLSKAVDAIEDGIERRAARLWAPRWVGPAIVLRTLLQPLTERRALQEPERLAAALRAATETSEASNSDPLLGVAVPIQRAPLLSLRRSSASDR